MRMRRKWEEEYRAIFSARQKFPTSKNAIYFRSASKCSGAKISEKNHFEPSYWCRRYALTTQSRSMKISEYDLNMVKKKNVIFWKFFVLTRRIYVGTGTNDPITHFFLHTWPILTPITYQIISKPHHTLCDVLWLYMSNFKTRFLPHVRVFSRRNCYIRAEFWPFLGKICPIPAPNCRRRYAITSVSRALKIWQYYLYHMNRIGVTFFPKIFRNYA